MDVTWGRLINMTIEYVYFSHELICSLFHIIVVWGSINISSTITTEIFLSVCQLFWNKDNLLLFLSPPPSSLLRKVIQPTQLAGGKDWKSFYQWFESSSKWVEGQSKGHVSRSKLDLKMKAKFEPTCNDEQYLFYKLLLVSKDIYTFCKLP